MDKWLRINYKKKRAESMIQPVLIISENYFETVISIVNPNSFEIM